MDQSGYLTWPKLGFSLDTINLLSEPAEASSFTRFDQMKRTDENDATGEDDKVSESVGN